MELSVHYPESRVPVINLEDGSRLSGDEAPLKRDLDKWLDEHPGYMVDRPPEMYPLEDEELSEVFIQSIKRTCIILMHYLVYECCLNIFNEQSECHSIKIEFSPVNFTFV